MLVFGDIHGCFETFKALYTEVKALHPDEQVVMAGDLPDRGPKTREVIQFVIDNGITAVQGNHEFMMYTAWVDPDYLKLWLQNGGMRALQSYCLHQEFVTDPDHDCEGLQALRAHQQFLTSLPFYLEFPEVKHANGRHLLVSHAPLSAGNLEKQVAKEDFHGNKMFIWNRDKPPRGGYNKKWFNVHGHNPTKLPDITDWYANVDTGCAYTRFGNLTCLRFPQMEVFSKPCID